MKGSGSGLWMSEAPGGKMKNPQIPSPTEPQRPRSAQVKRAMLADFCRVWGDRLNGDSEAPPALPVQPPEQGVEGGVVGGTEKEVPEPPMGRACGRRWNFYYMETGRSRSRAS